MAADFENLSVRTQRTRRNVVKMGAILAPSILAGIKAAHAYPGPPPPPPPPPPRSPPGPCSDCKCFLKGTKIETAEGERKVEDLAIGDLLPTMFGGMRAIQWIGRYPLTKTDPSKAWAQDAQPIRIARSALGSNVPHADLYVTAWHAVLIDGVLVPAEMLVNGATIARFEARERDELEFFHVKLESHDVIYAEGAPVETLMDVDERAVNFADYFRKYGQPTTQEAPCAPIVRVGGLGELKSRMRSAVSPWFDRRDQADVVRDRLEERGFSWQSEFAG